MLLYEDKIKENRPEFVAKVKQISTALNIEPDWLQVIMYHESRFNHRVINSIGAVGLIQIMPDTARGLGTTNQALAAMSNVQQLDYVYQYFKPAKGKFKTFEDLFLYNFFPIAVGKPDDWVLRSSHLSAEAVAKSNKPFDLNNDNQITVGEWKQYLRNFLRKNNIIIPQKKS